MKTKVIITALMLSLISAPLANAKSNSYKPKHTSTKRYTNGSYRVYK